MGEAGGRQKRQVQTRGGVVLRGRIGGGCFFFFLFSLSFFLFSFSLTCCWEVGHPRLTGVTHWGYSLRLRCRRQAKGSKRECWWVALAGWLGCSSLGCSSLRFVPRSLARSPLRTRNELVRLLAAISGTPIACRRRWLRPNCLSCVSCFPRAAVACLLTLRTTVNNSEWKLSVWVSERLRVSEIEREEGD